MTDVNVDLVNGKDATDLLQDRSTRCLHAVSAQERVDVIGVNAVVVDDAVTLSAGELP